MALTTVSSDRLSTNVKTSNLGTELKGKVGQNKNLMINGACLIAQRGTSSTSVNSDGLTTCDRWRTNIDSYGAYTITQSTTVPTGEGFTNSFKIDCTTADASPGSGDLFTFEQRFEGQEVQMFKKGTSSEH